jgi:zinc protease
MKSRIVSVALSIVVFLIGSMFKIVMAQTETPPPPSAPRPLSLPKPVEKTLANGLRVIVIERSGVPLVTARLIVKSGAEVDPPQLAGLANMTADLLTKGTSTRTAPQIAEAIESLGGSLESAGLWDNSSVQIEVMSQNFEPALGIMADVVRHPSFTKEEVERQRQQSTDELLVDYSEPGTIAQAAAMRLLYRDAPYGHMLQGTPESIERVTREDAVKLHSTYYRPDNAVLVIVGEIKPDSAFRFAESSFGDWQKPSTPVPSIPVKTSAAADSAAPILVVDKPDAGQAAVVLVREGLQRTDPDYFSAIVTNSVLSGYSGRLNQEIRIKRGLSYGARSVLEMRRGAGPFMASTQTKNQSGAEVSSILLSELRRLADEQVADTELAPRKAVLIGNFGRNLETNTGIVAQVGALALYGLSLEEIDRYIPRVQAIQSSDVHNFAGTRLGVKGAHVVMVGDAKQFLPELQKQGISVEVIPVAQLDLNNGSLRKK